MIRNLINILKNYTDYLLPGLLPLFFWWIGSLSSLQKTTHILLVVSIIFCAYITIKENKSDKISTKKNIGLFIISAATLLIAYTIWRLYFYTSYSAILIFIYIFVLHPSILAYFYAKNRDKTKPPKQHEG
ncbi:MAG: hypothetical protein VX185_16980 [Pseudomonadota bacterium]|nr:hypothetical protein [Pseudomonadota bacterium]